MFGEKRKYVVQPGMDGKRVDQVLSLLELNISRQYLQKLIKEKRVWLGKKYLKPSYKVNTNDEILVDYPLPLKMAIEPIKMPLEIVFEDEFILVINKMAGVVVHPAENGKFMGKSLVNAVLAHVGKGLKGIGGVMRPGIVHRLDKDTSGLIIVAKTDLAHQRLVEMFKTRVIKKRYTALVCGYLKTNSGRIDAPIGRDPVNRKKMAVNGLKSKEAISEFKVIDRYKVDKYEFSLIEVDLMTGRTHQIRVHMNWLGHPLVGDKLYGKVKINHFFSKKVDFSRQFLEASELAFFHPITSKKLDLKVDLADDLKSVLNVLEKL